MKSHLTKSNLYSTVDLGIAVYLFTIGHELKETSLQGPKRLIFHFKKQRDTESKVTSFLNETGEASAKKLFENYRALRALAFTQTGNLR
ncbi:MAG: DUF5659 domain-containing protein [Deltaproteobacteria bacterium]|nr:DUF5659 domain-containing protein [Deltaproteobacteria bacterium]